MKKGKGLLRRPLFCLAVLAYLLAGTLAAAEPADPVLVCAGDAPVAAVSACTAIIDHGELDGVALATIIYDRARALHHRSHWFVAIQGGESAAARDLRGALADYSRAVERNPTLAAAYVNRGIIHYEMGEFALAIADYDTAISLRPNLAEAWNNRSLARHRLGQYDLAKADFDQTIRLNKNYGNALINRELGPFMIPFGTR